MREPPRCACGDPIRGDDQVCAACRGTDRYINQQKGTKP